jgi:hypothetical protein
MKPEQLNRHINVDFLKPQVINGWSMMSFCVLNLDKIMLAPFPPIIRIKALTCAYRAAVVDHSKSEPEPSVWITDRDSNLRMIKLFSPLIIRDKIPRIDAAIGHDKKRGSTHIQFSFMNGDHYFSAEIKPAKDPHTLHSEVFKNVDEFSTFIKAGVSSYTPSSKEDIQYQAMDARIEFSWLKENWKDAPMIFDSAVKATGANYKWTYRGLVKS